MTSTHVPRAILDEMQALYNTRLMALKAGDLRTERIKHGRLLKLLDDNRSAIIEDLLELQRVSDRMAV
jgi:hypothetical protein